MKHLTLIIALLWALGASGQIYIDSYRFGGAPATGLLLDDYPNAAAAYSLRLLRTAYTGDCIVVRRSSNNDTLAIGFSGNYLDTAALKTFCSGTNCFVRRWYDQSTNSIDAIQFTDANQPRIATSGALIYDAGHPTLVFSTSFLTLDDVASLVTPTDNPIQLFTVAKGVNNAIGNILTFGGAGTNQFWRTTLNSSDFEVVKRDAVGVLVQNSNNTQNSSGVMSLWSIIDTGTRLTTAKNSSVVDNDINFDIGAKTFTLATLGVLRYNSGSSLLNYLNGAITEAIIYSSNQLSNRTGVESNINSFYNIY